MELADTSAWSNRLKSADVALEFDRLLRGREIGLCAQVELELLWSARDADDFAALRQELGSLPRLEIDAAVWQRAADVFELLARQGPLHHRQVPIPDLLIAATAELAGIPVCHYDRDFETIAAATGQPVRAIAPLGSL